MWRTGTEWTHLAVVRLQEEWRADDGEEPDEGIGDGRLALRDEGSCPAKLGAMVNVSQDPLERPIRLTLHVYEVDLRHQTC